jgi:subtilisin family serine protease
MSPSQQGATRRAATLLLSLAVLLLGGLVPAAGGTASVAQEPPGGRASAPLTGASAGRTVTLITGDQVSVVETSDGRRAATVVPGQGRQHVAFQTIEIDGALSVIPLDAMPYISSGVVDARLFEVSTLLDEGYADVDGLPLIVSWSDRARTSEFAVAGAETERLLPSLNAAAVKAEDTGSGRVWRAITPGGGPVAATPEPGSRGQLSDDLRRVWLDGKAHAILDRSVLQIGAPAAWDAGYRGDGVEVAILDTGVDSGHPDLAGQLAQVRDFTSSPSGIRDVHGHGTHVASIIAGTGASSAGTHTGVAPEADLFVGKVLGDDGYGFDSEIIAGMEWAAAEGADVVNMSLGGGASDGTDPLSMAVDAISKESGTLFVVAAGNDGADETVATPSVAASALSVAAVDRNEALAPFSSRGPRIGDSGLKPDISAPGVGIEAARASGTSMGTPVDQYYTAASGTSMAAPHVAGAAALLAQRHPDWTGQQIKDALMSTSIPNEALGVYEQGAGRVDVRRAISQMVTATGSADFERHSVTDTTTVHERTITYRNDSDSPITLTLQSRLASPTKSADSALTVPADVSVPANGSVDVTVRLDTATLAAGRWSGEVVGTSPDGTVVRTAVGTVQAGPRHLLNVRVLGFDGRPSAAASLTVMGDHIGTEHIGFVGEDGFAQLDLEEGDYVVHAVIADYANQQDQRLASLIEPLLHVTTDRELVLDGSTARPIEIATPEVAEPQTLISWNSYSQHANGRQISNGVMTFEDTRPWVTPTKPVSAGTFEFSSRWQLVRPSALVSVVGSDFEPQTTLLPESPVFDGRRRLDLVAAGAEMRGVRGKAVVVDAPDPGVEPDLVNAAARAGAEAIILVRPDWNNIRTVFEPALDRGPIPALLTTARDGARLIAAARGPRKARIDVETSRSSPYLYDVMQVSRGVIPDRIVHTVTKSNSHRVDTTYVDSGGQPFALEQRFGWRPWATYAWADNERMVQTGRNRVEWVSSGDSVWEHRVAHHPRRHLAGPLLDGLVDTPRTYAPGKSMESWYDPVVRPAAVPWSPSTRTGNRILLQLPQFVDAEGHHSIDPATTAARVYRDGQLLAELPEALGWVDVPEGEAQYRIDLDVARTDDPEWERGVRTSTSWVFRSQRPEQGVTEQLRMLQVAYAVPTDEMGAATRRRHSVSWQVTNQVGGRLPGARLDAEASFDGGRTWRRLQVRFVDNRFVADVPAGTAPVSLRIRATDGASRLEQEIIDAYDRR